VGLIGLLPPDLGILTMKQNLGGLSVLDADSVVTYHSRTLRQKDSVDLVIVLSHTGFDQDTSLAARHNDIDVIVGGHTHLPLFQPFRKNRAIIVQAGSWGRWLGVLDLVVDLAGDSVRSHTGELVETRAGVYPADSIAQRHALTLEQQVDAELEQVIGTLTTDWKRSFRSESNIGNWIADAMRSFAKTDIALMNSGGIRKDLAAGPITRRDIWEISPFGNSLVTFNLRGDSLLHMLEWQTERTGEVLQVSGLSYGVDASQLPGHRVVRALVSGKSIDSRGTYSVVTNNYVAGHAAEFLGLSYIGERDLQAIDRDVLIDAILLHPIVTCAVEGRIVTLTPTTPEEKRQ
jgi:2',3'-cyclic-nucleotide 2'-phosphodiesterase (5'-nucleotidase family)